MMAGTEQPAHHGHGIDKNDERGRNIGYSLFMHFPVGLRATDTDLKSDLRRRAETHLATSRSLFTDVKRVPFQTPRHGEHRPCLPGSLGDGGTPLRVHYCRAGCESSRPFGFQPTL